MQGNEPVQLEVAQRGQAAELLARAFHNDPTYRLVIPEEDKRAEVLSWLFDRVVHYSPAVSNIPAAIPAKTEDIKNDLARDLGMNCQPERSAGQEMAYTRWECENPSGDGLAYVAVFSRKLAPDRIDSVHALTGETDPQKELAFFVTVATLAVPSADPQLVQDWLAKTQPTLNTMGSKAEIAVNGVKFVLSNPHGMGLVLEIGEIK